MAIVVSVLIPLLIVFIIAFSVVRHITGKNNAGAAKVVLKDPYDVAISSAVAQPDVEAPVSDEAKPAVDVVPQPPEVSDVVSHQPDVPVTDEERAEEALRVQRDALKQAEIEAAPVDDDDSESLSDDSDADGRAAHIKKLQAELVELRAWKKSMEALLAGAAAEADAANAEMAVVEPGEGNGITPMRV